MSQFYGRGRAGSRDESLPVPPVSDGMYLGTSGGAGLAMPEPESNERQSSLWQQVSSTVWWLFATIAVFVGFLLHSETPKWVLAVVAAEGYASMRRLARKLSKKGGANSEGPRKVPLAASRHRRLRHFTSARLRAGAPVEEIIGAFIALDAMPAVRSIELGSNFSSEGKSRNHTLGFLVTFGGQPDRAAFLASEQRAAFLEFAGQYVEEWFIYDFESGAV